MDTDGIIVNVNDSFCRISEYTREKLLGKECSIFNSISHKDICSQLQKVQTWKGEVQNLSKSGSLYWLDMKITPLLDAAGEITGYISLSNDITKLKTLHTKLNNIISSTNDIIYTLNAEGVFEFVSPSWTTLLGHELKDVVNRSFTPFVHPDDILICAEYLNKVLSKELKPNESVTYRVFHKDSSIRYHQSKASVLEETPSNFRFLAIASDITQSVLKEKEIQEKNRELEKLATIDYLTGLYNRVKIDDILTYELNKFQRYGETFGIIMIDIDFFKIVNDVHGHQVGDKVLVEFSKELLNSSRLSDSIGRWGGEEFLIISPNIDEKGLLAKAQEIRKSVEKFNFSVVGQKTISIGVSLIRENDEINRLIKRADDALYEAKESGRNRVCIK